MGDRDPIVGIDLGTTNSLVGVFREGRVELCPNALGNSMTPSVVGIDDDGQVLVGNAAQDRLVTRPELTAAAFKRYMGTDRAISLGRREFRPEELSALVLKSLKADAEAMLGHPVTEAVITVPAYFNDVQRKATRTAGELAGLKVERLLNEPTAAALAYGLHRRDEETLILVLDLGGGTFDVSLLDLFEGVMEVRASGGDNFLGGEDFVHRMMDRFVEATGSAELMDDFRFRGRLREQAERAKRRLSEEPSAELRVRHAGRELSWEIDQTGFEALSEPLLTRLEEPVKRVLRDSGVKARDLHEVLLVGGASRMPLVQRLATRLLGRMPSIHPNLDEVVCFGAALQGALKARDQALADVVVTDVCPYTLGVEVISPVDEKLFTEGHYLPIIERNVAIPTSRMNNVVTTADRQKAIHIKIYQGESRLVKDNIHLGTLVVPVPRNKAGAEGVDVRFTYDVDGLLEVEATATSVGEVHRLIIDKSDSALTSEEIQKRFDALAKLKIHPRDQTANRALLARAGRLYEEHVGLAREILDAGAKEFEGALALQDEHTVRRARSRLLSLIVEIEGEFDA